MQELRDSAPVEVTEAVQPKRASPMLNERTIRSIQGPPEPLAAEQRAPAQPADLARLPSPDDPAIVAADQESEPGTGAQPEADEVPGEIKFWELEPIRVYEKNGYTYHTDEAGRVVEISGRPHLTDEPQRSRHGNEVGKLGEPADVGGHFIGARFDGPTDGFNLAPQNANLNNSAWRKMENRWAAGLEQGKDVEVIIFPAYLGDSRRPAGYDVLYDIGQERHSAAFWNEAGAREESVKS